MKNNKLTEHLGNSKYIEDVAERLESGLEKTFDRDIILSGTMNRNLNSPKEITTEGSRRGIWKNSTFFYDDDFIPKNNNNYKLTIREIKIDLENKYGLNFNGIEFREGVADFSSISLANISTQEMFTNITGISERDYKVLNPIEKAKLFSTVFMKEKRDLNFSIADEIVARKQLKIPGLEDGYTKDDLKKWRSENGFSWDEQIGGGYNLVPTIIHQNISHTGLVSISNKSYKNYKKRKEQIKNNPELYAWDESTAPISIKELANSVYIHKIRKEKKDMARSRIKTRGMDLGRHVEKTQEGLQCEASDKVKEGDKLAELGKKFIADKNKLEDEIDKVNAANINEKDKARLVAQLNAAIEALQEQYDNDVAEEEEKIQEELEAQIESMDEQAKELETQIESLREVKMEAASTDAKAAADTAQEQKEAFEQMKNEYVEKLNLQIEQAANRQREIRARRLRGK